MGRYGECRVAVVAEGKDEHKAPKANKLASIGD